MNTFLLFLPRFTHLFTALSQQKQNICLPTNVLFLFIQAAGLAYHHDAVVYIISPTGCISSRASVYLFCGLMIYNTSC